MVWAQPAAQTLALQLKAFLFFFSFSHLVSHFELKKLNRDSW